MTFKEVLNHLTGISSPLFGVSWNPPYAEVTKARRVLRFWKGKAIDGY
jgi:hypothetical protein